VTHPENTEPLTAQGDLDGFFQSRNLNSTLNHGVKLYVKYKIAAAIIGAILFLIILFGFFLPQMGRMNSSIDSFPRSGQPSFPNRSFP
jgi:hypothetical protein